MKKRSKERTARIVKLRLEFFKKHPDLEKRRIENMKKALRSKEARLKHSLVMKRYYKEHPNQAKKISKSLKISYAKNPELRLKISIAMKKVFKEHPNLKAEFRKNFLDYLRKNPKVLENLSKTKGNPNPLDVKTLREDYVRSRYESAVADCLFVNRIKYEYEKRVLIFRKELRWAIPDFYLPEYKLYIEVFGGYPGSQAKTRWKKKIYKKYRIKFIGLHKRDILNLDKNLLKKLK